MRRLAGLSIAGLEAGPLAAFASLLPETSAPPDVTIAARTIAVGSRKPLYFLGVTQVFTTDAGYRLEARGVAATVASDGATVALEGDPRAPFAEGLAHAALLLALRLRGRYELHAAAVVAKNGSAILVVGDAGAGKTTTLLALAEADFPWLGDDRVLLRDGGVDGYPRALHLGERTLAMFPDLAPHAAEPEGTGEKRRVEARVALPAGFRSSAGWPGALILPRVEPEKPTRAWVTDGADAFGALLEAAAIALVDGLPGRDEHLALLRAIEASARPFRLALGGDALTDPSVVVRALRAVRAVS